MIGLTEQERGTLTVLGVIALAALGVLVRQRRPLDVVRAAVLSVPRLAFARSGQCRAESRHEVEGRPAQAARWEQQLRDARRLDVNTASAAALERLPEVGPALAQRIVDDRTLHGRFRRPEELMRVKGIGPKTYDALREYVEGEQ